jgi:signal transduction histidine kinase
MDNVYILIFYGIGVILLLVFFFLLLYIRNQNMLWKQRKLFQETEITQQKELLNAVIESQELERKRIGGDLHDQIGGTLSAIKLMLGAIQKDEKDIILPAKELIDQMIVEVRNIAHDLSPPGLAMFGLYTTLEGFIASINKTGAIEIELAYADETHTQLPNETISLALFRVITQLLANTLTHAAATKVQLHFEAGEQLLKISYDDNGKGFDVAILNEKRGIGMQNILSRLQMINATYAITTSPNNGFGMKITCPI